MSTFVEGKEYKVVGNSTAHWYNIGDTITAQSTPQGRHDRSLDGFYWFRGKNRTNGEMVNQLLRLEDIVDVNFLSEAKEKKMAKATSGKQNLWLVESTTKTGKVQTYARATRAEARLTKNRRKAVGDTNVQIVRFERTQVVR